VSTRKLLWFEITKMMIAVLRNKSIVSFSIIFGTLSFPMNEYLMENPQDKKSHKTTYTCPHTANVY